MAHILVVDDDEMIAEMAAEVLIDAGHACGWLTDADKALSLLKWRRPDLLLLDQDMPGLSGQQMLRELRQSAQNYDLPVIMFTAMTGADNEQAALSAGAQDYVHKPFDPKFLLLKVRQVLAARAERPQHRSLREILEESAGTLRDRAPVLRAVI